MPLSTAAPRPWQALLDGLPVPAVVVDPRGSVPVLAANPVFEAMAGRPIAAGADLDEALAQTWLVRDATALAAGVTAAAATRERHRIPLRARPQDQRGDRRAQHWTATLHPLDDGGDATLVLVVVTRDDAVGRASTDSSVLRGLSLELGEPPDDDAFDGALTAALTVTAARRGVVLRSEDGGPFAVAAAAGDAAEAPQRPIADPDGALRRFALRGHAATLDEAGAAGDALRSAAPGWERLLLCGLRVRGRAAAVVVVADPAGGAFEPAAAERLELVAALAAAGVDNRRLLDDLRRLADLLRAAVDTTSALVQATEPGALRRRLLLGLHRDVGVDAAALWIPAEDGGLALADEVGLPAGVRAAVATLPPASVADRLARGRVSGVRGRGVVAERSQAWPGRRVHLVRVPEPAPGVLGVYVPRPLPALVDEVLVTLAHTLAAAVHQTTLHRRAQTVVDSLQRQMRPGSVPLPADAERGHVYRSATAGVEVGGDFFDLFLTRSGHIGLVCGDVSGKGVEAASLTAMAVYSVRAYALQGTAPQQVVTMVNAAVSEQTTVERFMTLAYARIDQQTWTAEVTVAGHPPPIVVAPDRVTVHEVLPDVPLGVDPTATFHQHQLRLRPGDSLLLHTDGVTEARRGERGSGPLLGTEGLLRALDPLRGLDAQALADAVWDAVEAWTGGGTTDDCAIVVLRRRP